MLPLTKRQREILDFLNDFIQQHGYAPSLEEIGKRFSLSSLATVHKHLTNLQEKGFIKRAWNRSRSVEVVPNLIAALQEHMRVYSESTGTTWDAKGPVH
jgi:repressor LexA